MRVLIHRAAGGLVGAPFTADSKHACSVIADNELVSSMIPINIDTLWPNMCGSATTAERQVTYLNSGTMKSYYSPRWVSCLGAGVFYIIFSIASNTRISTDRLNQPD